jgi:hypothetical protein
VRIDPSGAKTVVATGLNSPGGMTFGPDGALYVSNFSFAAPAGAGQVVRIEVPLRGKKLLHATAASESSAPTIQANPEANPGPTTTQQSSVFIGQIGSDTGDTDVSLQQGVAKALGADSELSSISVTVTGGHAVLKGTVTSAAAKAKAEKVVKAVRGVKSIDNKIEVSTP